MTTTKKSLAIVLAVMLLLLALVPLVTLNAFAGEAETREVTININYYRYNNDYSGWDSWVWTAGAEATSGTTFTKTSTTENSDGSTVTWKLATKTFDMPLAETSIGYIVRYNNWADREQSYATDGNRLAVIPAGNENLTINAYCVEGDKAEYYETAPAVDTAATIKMAEITKTAVKVTMRGSLGENDTVQLKINGEMTECVAEEQYGNVFVFAPEEGINMENTYTIVYKAEGKDVVEYTAGLSSSLINSDEFKEMYNYTGELGAIWDSHETTFNLWTPFAGSVKLQLFEKGDGGNPYKTVEMAKCDNGLWQTVVEGDLHGKYYTYLVSTGSGVREAVDPYARSVGVNGNRGMILDLSTTNPDGWDDHSIPTTKPRDAVIYEAHVRDLTIDASSGVSEANRGKFLGLTEKDTVNSFGQSTVLDHMVELGVNYLHLLPIFDYASVDETKLDTPQFNWGYDPKNYNAPEGSYSTNPYNGEVRVNELKQAVMAVHESGIKVVMDVVYNHTYSSSDSFFNMIAPGYYHRTDATGNFYNGSGCGNETASERAMMRKFMVESVVYWATEYKIDGFRFDLMGLHDIDTMNAISEALHEINPDILIYGEGWTGGTSGLAVGDQALKANADQLNDIAVFNDNTRDGIKGSVFDAAVPGYVNGAVGQEPNVLLGTIGAIKGSRDFGLTGGYTNSPLQCINYVSAHDNLTLFDKLAETNPNSSEEDRLNMNKAAAFLVLTGQGIPFMTNGEEIARSKGGDENSYNASDEVNSIKWDTKNDYLDLFNFYKTLIKWRADNADLFFSTADDVRANVSIISSENGYIAFALNCENNYAEVQINISGDPATAFIPEGNWTVDVAENTTGDAVGTETVEPQTLNAYGMLIISKTDSVVDDGGEDDKDFPVGAVVGASAGVAAAGGGGTAITLSVLKRKKINIPVGKK